MEINNKHLHLTVMFLTVTSLVLALVVAHKLAHKQFLYYKYNELNCIAYTNKHPYKNGFEVVKISFERGGIMKMYEDSNGRKLYATQFDRLECE